MLYQKLFKFIFQKTLTIPQFLMFDFEITVINTIKKSIYKHKNMLISLSRLSGKIFKNTIFHFNIKKTKSSIILLSVSFLHHAFCMIEQSFFMNIFINIMIWYNQKIVKIYYSKTYWCKQSRSKSPYSLFIRQKWCQLSYSLKLSFKNAPKSWGLVLDFE